MTIQEIVRRRDYLLRVAMDCWEADVYSQAEALELQAAELTRLIDAVQPRGSSS